VEDVLPNMFKVLKKIGLFFTTAKSVNSANGRSAIGWSSSALVLIVKL
jgi:hypothetical protein